MNPVFTIGHGRRTQDELAAMLEEARVSLLVDVRRFPRSRTNPQFDESALAPALAARGIGYEWMQALGGRRSGAAKSRHTAWEVEGFRAYAAYAETPEFRAALGELWSRASRERAAIMCSEVVWWRCHRRIVTDYLLARGARVVHLMAPGKSEEAKMTPFARVEGETLVYSA